MKKHIGLLLALGSLAIAQTSYALHYTVFEIELNGANEVGSGDPDGIGGGTLNIDAATNEIVWDFGANNIYVPIGGFHIHNAPAGASPKGRTKRAGAAKRELNASWSAVGLGENSQTQDSMIDPIRHLPPSYELFALKTGRIQPP